MESLVMQPKSDFWLGKRVLLTGHTGFKGAWLVWWLHRMGAQVTGMAQSPLTQPNLFELLRGKELCDSHLIDLKDLDAVQKLMYQSKPDIVLHLAAQAIVRTAYEKPVTTFATNVLGTVHLLEAMRTMHAPRVVVAVTTDKVYQNREWPHPYREGDPLGGHDPYSASKAACEIAINSYVDSYLGAKGTSVARARAGNVIGGGDWSANRLIPDAVQAWVAGKVLDVRRPDSVRPWQHVLEPLSAYLILAEKLWHDPSLADAYNFGPSADQAASVREVITLAQQSYGQGRIRFANNIEGPHEAGLLALDNAKARSLLGVSPRWKLDESIRRSLIWYRDLAQGANADTLCQADLDAFLETT
jgi:CDP-glucose 4,6-dehydratase